MHLFLYQANRHAAPAGTYSYHNNRNRYKQGTIRGDFDLELLKRGIKGRYKILPHGEHEFQKALREIELQEEFYGHVVQIEQASNAIWFKLNYDQVGKHVTKYIGGWRDLDPEAIKDDIAEFKLLKTQQQRHGLVVSAVRNHEYNMKSFMSRITDCPPSVDAVRFLTLELQGVAQKTMLVLNEEAKVIADKITVVQDRVRAYLKERKF